MSNTAPKNSLEQRLHKSSQEAGQPVNEQDRIGYAIIEEVKVQSSQVKIRLLKADGDPGEVLPGYHPLLNPIDDLQNRFGALRKGMVCRIFWKGKLRPKNPIVEVIGPEGHTFLTKKAFPNKVDTGPHAIFSGGVA